MFPGALQNDFVVAGDGVPERPVEGMGTLMPKVVRMCAMKNFRKWTNEELIESRVKEKDSVSMDD